jgi:hypothetical protein
MMSGVSKEVKEVPREGVTQDETILIAGNLMRNVGDIAAIESAAVPLLQFDTMARPSELLLERSADLVPLAGGRGLRKLLHHNDTIAIGATDPERAWLSTVAAALKQSSPMADQPLFGLLLVAYERKIADAAKTLNFGKGLPQQFRQGSASLDPINQVHLAMIKTRGRWASASSEARYEKPGRNLLRSTPLSASQLRDVELEEKRMIQ